MKKYTIYIYSILALFTMSFAGCDLVNTVDLEVPNSEPRLVINSFISPSDSFIKVEVSRSKPILKSKPTSTIDYITNAEVFLSNGSEEVQLTYDSNINQYLISSDEFPIEAGKRYTLRAKSVGGLSAQATCQVPSSFAEITQIVIDTVKESLFEDTGEMEEFFEFNVKWNDVPNVRNYYRVYGELINEGSTGFSSRNPISEFRYYTDLNRENESITARALSDSPITSGSDRVDVYLLTVDTHYYQYHITLEQNDPENPFAEPNPIYTNIENGFGIFAAYQIDKRTILLK